MVDNLSEALMYIGTEDAYRVKSNCKMTPNKLRVYKKNQAGWCSNYNMAAVYYR